MSGVKKRFLSLDIVRGIAALSVLMSHWGGWTISYAGPATKNIIKTGVSFVQLLWAGGGIHPGVIVFIVLSGFCIHLPQTRQPDRFDKAGSWKTFALRRAIRIMPVYWIALFMGVIGVLITGAGNGSENNVISFDLFLSAVGFGEIAR